jgi:ABC-type antimicrobial peptide transport system permease subunit
MVLWESLRTVGRGAVVGLALALAAAYGLGRVLYGVRPLDPVVLPGVTLLIALVALVAALAPARRAAGVDPVTAMRTE